MTETVLKEAQERFKESEEATDFNRNNAESDIKFSRLSDQWPEGVKKLREEEGRPCLTINRLPSFIRQVVNDSRQNKPSIAVHPVDNGADVATAEMINGIIRSIERASPADVAYDTAIDHAVSGGFGFFRIGIDYAHDETFDLEAKIHRVPNPLMVHWDPNSTRFDAADWDFAFVSDFLSERQFEAKYPKAKKVHFEGDNKDAVNYWLDDGNIRVAEYWQREEVRHNLILLSDGQAVREDDLPAMAREVLLAGGMDPEGGTEEEMVRAVVDMTGVYEVRRREVVAHKVVRRILTGAEVLEEEDWPGSMIPICPVWGDEVIVDGRRHFRSLIRDARDPQQMLNFWRSATTELVALAPRAPWVGPQGFIPAGHEKKWENANTRSYSTLEYDTTAGKPERQPFAGVPAGALQEALSASDDMKNILGMFDAALGAQSNETSGRAILARQRESDVSSFHFIDNLSRAIQYAGKVLVEIIPAVYSQRQTIRILGEDQTETVARLEAGAQAKEDGTRDLYDLTVGKYDVTVKAGPSYATQREETREVLVEIMSKVPAAAPLIGDILLEHMDFQGADKVAERLKMMLPPQIQAAEGIQPNPGMPPMMPGGAPMQPNPGAPGAQPGQPGPIPTGGQPIQ